jgi:hypothetical protein
MLELFCNDKGWSSDFRLWTLQISLLDKNHYHQPVRKRVSQQGAEENSPKPHSLIDSNDLYNIKHFVQPEACHG